MNVIEGKNPNTLNIKDSYKNLHEALGDEAFAQYTNVLKRYFGSKINKFKFDEDARKLLVNNNQIHLHNLFLLALSDKITSGIPQNPPEVMTEGGTNKNQNTTYGIGLPDQELLKGRMCIAAIDHGLEGSEDAVTTIVHTAARMFVKNIIAAMLSRGSGYKIRENNFQYAMGTLVPNPWLRNTNNIIDNSQYPSVNYNNEINTLEPGIRCSRDVAEQQEAFIYSCHNKTDNVVQYTLKSLYETLFHNPQIINNHTIHSINLERILGKLDCN